jgi:hypothetical protein
MTFVGNIIEGVEFFTSTQVARIQTMREIQTSQASDPTVGGVLSYGGASKNALDAFIQSVTAEYSWLYYVDSTLTESQCSTAGGRWNSTSSVCMLHNQYYIIWIFAYWAISAGVLISFGLTLARLIRGV